MQHWSPIEIYNKLATYCFVTEPLKRGCFSHLVQVIEGVLNDDEKLAYKELTDQYASMRELLLDETNRFKRSISQYKKDDTEANYSKFTEKSIISSPDDSSPLISNNVKSIAESSEPKPSTYTTLQNVIDLKENHSIKDENVSNSYKMLQDIIEGCNDENPEQSYSSYIHMNSNSQNESLIEENADSGNVPCGYISIECANI